MSAWVPFKQSSEDSVKEVVQKNIEIRTAQRQTWAKSVNQYKLQDLKEETDFVKMVRATALKDWQKQNELNIKEIRFSFTLVKNNVISRISRKILNPFSKTTSHYRLIPSKNQNDSNNVEITFICNEKNEWVSKTNLVDPSEYEFSNEPS